MLIITNAFLEFLSLLFFSLIKIPGLWGGFCLLFFCIMTHMHVVKVTPGCHHHPQMFPSCDKWHKIMATSSNSSFAVAFVKPCKTSTSKGDFQILLRKEALLCQGL